ncbi:MAG: hypothetical protein IPK12_06605 [Gemmatimonadetes bacterium]|nr:hypothetical protein [Gemmatimonadota bacterium]
MCPCLFLSLFLGFAAPAAAQTTRPAMPTLTKLTPVLMVDRIAPCLPFWTERLGFANVAEVPGPDGQPQFALLVKDGVEVMYQTYASVEAEDPTLVAGPRGQAAMFFLEVDNLDATLQAMQGIPIVVPRHTTFYGKEEFAVREPGGAVVIFAMDVPAK